jgi:tRNA(His) 5'-end guanylyltransferase
VCDIIRRSEQFTEPYEKECHRLSGSACRIFVGKSLSIGLAYVDLDDLEIDGESSILGK